MTMLRLSTADAVLAGGVLCAVAKVDPALVALRPLDGAAAPWNLTHAELAELLAADKASIEYGYFSDREAARRALAGRELLSLLPAAERREVFWKVAWCEAFLAAEAQGEVSRSDRRCTAFIPELERRIAAGPQPLAAPPACPPSDPPACQPRPAPCRTSLMGWVRAWEKTRDPMALVKRSRFNGANALRIAADREAVLQNGLPDYLHPNRITVPALHRAVNAAIRDRNRLRRLADLPALAEISESTVRRRVGAIDRFELCAARHGVAVARTRYGAHGAGLRVDVPLQRVEMDAWEIDLMTILAGAGADLTAPALRDLVLGRIWVCVAFDAASRSVLAVKLAKTPSVETALATVRMVMADKTAIARRLGCETPWRQHGHPAEIVVDNGPDFVHVEFKAALADLGIGYSVMPAGVPKLRARIERLFGTLVTMLMPQLTGRTFSNPADRGDYPSERHAVHTPESVLEALVRFVVDIYHNKAHRGLDEACPNDAWARLCAAQGWSPPLGRHRLRHVLGIRLERRLGRHGIRVCGVDYLSEPLVRFFQRGGGRTLEIRLDPENLGHVSVRFDDMWHSVPAVMDGMEGVSVAAWEQAVLEIRQRNRDASRVNREIIDRAFARIREIDAGQRAWRRLGPIAIGAAEIRRAEAESFFGLALKPEPDGLKSDGPKTNGPKADGPKTDGPHPVPGRSGAIDAINASAAARRPGSDPQLFPEGPTEPGRPLPPPLANWRFSDEDDDE